MFSFIGKLHISSRIIIGNSIYRFQPCDILRLFYPLQSLWIYKPLDIKINWRKQVLLKIFFINFKSTILNVFLLIMQFTIKGANCNNFKHNTIIIFRARQPPLRNQHFTILNTSWKSKPDPNMAFSLFH